jgi:hypothetical protein
MPSANAILRGLGRGYWGRRPSRAMTRHAPSVIAASNGRTAGLWRVDAGRNPHFFGGIWMGADD